MILKIDSPPILRGEADNKIAQLSSYLFRIAEALNVALQDIDNKAENAQEGLNVISGNSSSPAGGTDADGQSSELRELIINTASIVNSRIDMLRTELSSEYSALSDEWGEYQENITSTIEATADAVVQSYNYDAQISTLQEEAAGFSQYQTTTEGFIKQGFIDYDGGVPVIGIAIGQGLTSTTVTIDGTEYEQFDSTQSCAFYTSDKVSFRVNGQEVAYVSNQKLYITNAEITGSMTIDNWLISHTNGFSIKWIGG